MTEANQPKPLTADDTRRTGRVAWLAAPLVLFLLLAGLFYMRLGAGDPNRLPSVLIDKPVPEFALPAIEGYTSPPLTSDALDRGVSVVNVWASWCGPCRAEHPILMRLAEDNRFRIAGINQKDRPENARRFLGSLGDPYDLIGADTTGRASIDWGVYGVPETFIVKDGIIVHKFIGPLSQAGLENDFMPALEAALAAGG